MAGFEAYVDIPADQIVKLKFEQQLDELVRKDLISKLVIEMLHSDEIQINHYELPQTLSDPYQSSTRFYIAIEVKNRPY